MVSVSSDFPKGKEIEKVKMINYEILDNINLVLKGNKSKLAKKYGCHFDPAEDGDKSYVLKRFFGWGLPQNDTISLLRQIKVGQYD
jgi:hypothetical protein